MTKLEELGCTLPEKQPYEGRATQKQKQKLWEMGFTDQAVIDELGKKQASYLIDRIFAFCRVRSARLTARRWMLVFLLALIISAICMVINKYTTPWCITVGAMALGFLISLAQCW